ncbi:SAP domain-containing protein [Enterocloster clostridioformis]|uniref:SAP domain-containing protein n=1 Tax=Enterocloster clostridioformis TaxID=1531 RepID=UPI0004221CD4|nr:SAP domain-containing protein [Enterocloster clostridioformis]
MFNLFNLFKGKNKEELDSPPNYVDPEPIPQSPPLTSKNSLSQRQITHQIIEETALTNSATIDELDRIAQERSNRLYDERQQRVHNFNPFELNTKNVDTSPLSSVEKYFLKQMSEQSIENPTVYAYWVYEYSLNFETTMTKLLVNNYLQISDSFADLDYLTVVELKSILKQSGLSVSGKKAELIQRIKTNISIDQLSASLNDKNKRYMLTSKGKEAIAGLPKSMTKNLELEDHCLECIFKNNINEAYKLVCENELNKTIPRGIGMNWKQEYEKGLSSFKLQLYTNFLEHDTDFIPKVLKPYELQLKACVILGEFFGVAISKSADLFMRITDSSHISKSEILSTLQEMQCKLLTSMQQHTFDILHG